MSEIHANPIIDNKFWIVERDGEKFATLRKNSNDRFIMSNKTGIYVYDSRENLISEFGENFFVSKIVESVVDIETHEVNGYPTSVLPHKPIYDIKQKLPLFAKSKDSKNLYCAGYYVIKFDKGWVKSFCPKFTTLQKYVFKGPFKTKIEMQQVLSHVSK